MIICYIIGAILSFLGIYILKNSRVLVRVGYYAGQKVIDKKPCLRMWAVILAIICNIIPFTGIVFGVVIFITAIITFTDNEMEFLCPNRLKSITNFLNKPVK